MGFGVYRVLGFRLCEGFNVSGVRGGSLFAKFIGLGFRV